MLIIRYVHPPLDEDSYIRFDNFSPDCANLLSAINYNPDKVRQILKHSHQTEVVMASPKGFLEDFGTRQVSQSLVKAAEARSNSVIIEDPDARILFCADNMGLEVCESLQRVLTTNGYSVAFNAKRSKDSLLRSPGNRAFIKTLLDDEMRV